MGSEATRARSAVSSEGVKAAIKNMLERWHTKMLDELENLPEKLGEMGERCLTLKSLAAG